MNYRVDDAIKRNRANLIIFAILWLLISIFIVVPVSHSWHIASQDGSADMGIFIETIIQDMSSPQETFIKIIKDGAILTFLKLLGGTTLVVAIFCITGMARSAPKSEYANIEHGSSDWSKNGEQYQILSKKKGIILAENNYLPVDKRGNVNVLVVGRFWFW